MITFFEGNDWLIVQFSPRFTDIKPAMNRKHSNYKKKEKRISKN
jgi:hypothetical protein